MSFHRLSQDRTVSYPGMPALQPVEDDFKYCTQKSLVFSPAILEIALSLSLSLYHSACGCVEPVAHSLDGVESYI
jgi:hypothetical protein